jgi:hypothetical protein
MKCAKENLLLYAVTDRAWCGSRTLLEQVEEASARRSNYGAAAGKRIA